MCHFVTTEIALEVLNKCTQERNPSKDTHSIGYKVEYDYEFLEDFGEPGIILYLTTGVSTIK